MDDPGESEWEGCWNSQSFQGHRLTFLELKEALRNPLPTPEVTGGRQGPAPLGISTWNQGPHHSSHSSPPTPASGASSHLSCQPQGLCTHCPPFHLPSSPQWLLPSLTSTSGLLHTLFPSSTFPPPHSSSFHSSHPPQGLCTHCSFSIQLFSPSSPQLLPLFGPTEWDTSLGFSAHTAPYSPFKCF